MHIKPMRDRAPLLILHLSHVAATERDGWHHQDALIQSKRQHRADRAYTPPESSVRFLLLLVRLLADRHHKRFGSERRQVRRQAQEWVRRAERH